MRCNLCGSSSAFVFPCPIPGDPEARACGTCLEERCLASDAHRASWIESMEADAERATRPLALFGVQDLDDLLASAPRGDVSAEARSLLAAMGGA